MEWIGSENLPTLTALDRAAFGADRAALMNALAGEGRFAAITNADGIAAFAAVRAFGRGEVVGPVVAEDRDQAGALIAFILSGMQGRFVRIDIPEDAGLSTWLEGFASGRKQYPGFRERTHLCPGQPGPRLSPTQKAVDQVERSPCSPGPRCAKTHRSSMRRLTAGTSRHVTRMAMIGGRPSFAVKSAGAA